MAKVGEILKFKDGGLSVDDARKKMLEAKEQPSGMIVRPAEAGTPAADALEPELPAAPVEVPPVLTPEEIKNLENPDGGRPVESPAVVQPEPVRPSEVERIETDQFVGEIRQEGGQWVAELRYRLGEGLAPGAEKFSAHTKNALMLELLKGKGHATLRVKQAVRREKLGREVDRAYPLPLSMTSETFQNMAPEAQTAVLDGIAQQQCYEFRIQHPEFPQTVDNGKALLKFLHEQSLPVTVKNLEFAFEDLSENGVLERAPEKTSLAQPTVPTARVDSPPAAAAAPSAVASPPQAPAPPQAPLVRKRGSSGLTPGESSVPSTSVNPEDGGRPAEPSEAELRKLPLSELKRIADADRRKRAVTQR